MALTINTALISAKNRGRFVGMSLRATSKFPSESSVVRIKRVTPQYVTFQDKLGLAGDMKVHKSTISQIRTNGRTLNKA